MIPLKEQDLIRQKFAAELLGPVKIDYFTDRDSSLTVPGRVPCAYCKPTREMLQELAALSDLISLRMHIFDEAVQDRAKFGIGRIPGIVLRGPVPSGPSFKFYGMPGGTEFPAFLEAIVDMSRGKVLLSQEAIRDLKKLHDEITVRVFVTPSCGYCPQMTRAAYQLSLANPNVRAEVIEVNEFPDLADRYQVRAVPLTVIADKVVIPGAMHPDALVEAVVKASGSEVSEPQRLSGPTSAVTAQEEQPSVKRGQERPSGLIIP